MYPGQEPESALLTGIALRSTGRSESSTGTCVLSAGSWEHNPCPQMLPTEGWEEMGAFCFCFQRGRIVVPVLVSHPWSKAWGYCPFSASSGAQPSPGYTILGPTLGCTPGWVGSALAEFSRDYQTAPEMNQDSHNAGIALPFTDSLIPPLPSSAQHQDHITGRCS